MRKKKPPVKTRKLPVNSLLKEWSKNWKAYWSKKKSQTDGFLSRYDFAYTGRDTVNQVGKIAPGIINKATSDMNKIAKDRIDQVIKSGGAEVE